MSARGLSSTKKESASTTSYAADLAAIREKLARLAAAPTAGGRTKRLFVPAPKDQLCGAISAVAASSISPRSAAAAGELGAISTSASRKASKNTEERNRNHHQPLFQLVTVSPRSHLELSNPQLASGVGNNSGDTASVASANLLEASTIELMQEALAASLVSKAPPPASSTRTARTVAIRRQSAAPPPASLTPHNFAAAFRGNVCFSPKLWTCVLHRTAASAPVVVAARRRVFRLLLRRTAQKLLDDAIKLPTNSNKIRMEHRTVLGRELAKGLFNTNIYLRQNPTLDLREDILARRIAFQDCVDRNITFLVAWEVAMATKPTSSGSHCSSRGGDAEGSRQRMRKTPQLQKKKFAGGEAKRVCSFVVTHENVASRRLSRRASLADLTKVTHGSSSTRCTGVLDVRAILAAPYEGPVVSEAIKRRYASSSSTNIKPPSPSPRSPVHRRDSPSRLSTRRTPSRTPGVMFAAEEVAGGQHLNVISPIGTGSGVGGRWSELTDGLFETSLNDQAGPMMLKFKAAREKHHRTPAASPTSKGGRGLSNTTAVSSRSSEANLGGAPTLGAIRSPSRSTRSKTILAPLPRDVQIAASRLTDRDAPSQVIEQLTSYEKSVQDGCEERNPSVQFWFGKSSRPALDRTTESIRMRQLSPQVLSFYDEKGLIDGRAGANIPCRPRDGVMYSEERIVQARNAAAALEVKALRRQAPSGVSEGDGDDNVASEDGQVNGSDAAKPLPTVRSHRHHGPGSPPRRRVDYGPDHRTKPHPEGSNFAEPTAERLRDLLSTVFVRGGDVGSFIRKIEQDSKTGLKKPDIRRSNKDRLGGGAISRSVL